jgi:1-deoxy-D-xylulose-5-phosphate reductoisomerase
MPSQVKTRRIILLGSTGSIGLQTLDVIRSRPDEFRLVAISCHRRSDLLVKQINEFKPEASALSGTEDPVPANLPCPLYRGADGVRRLLSSVQADIVLNGIAGAAGLMPSFAALEAGLDLALANKETMVMAGALILELARRHGRRILPVDSEHSAVFQLLESRKIADVEEIILTASGGAFRDVPLDDLARMRAADALRHPTWSMGPKITVDSATMANKALEVMEAAHFFQMPIDKIKVVIHPQSLVHSLVRARDGVLYAQLSRPDMRLPIQYALSWPRLLATDIGRLDLAHTRLDFMPVEEKRYPLLARGYEAATLSANYPVAYNAANEVAVAAFLNGAIAYPDIARVVAETLAHDWTSLNRTMDDVILNDTLAREKARACL